MAEGILKDRLAQHDTQVEVSSAGVGTVVGWPASEGAMQACQEMGIDLSTHRSNPVTVELVRDSDLILTMERWQSDRVLSIDPQASEKVLLLGGFDPKAKRHEIDDPVGQPLEDFRECASHIISSIEGLLQQLPVFMEDKAVDKQRAVRVAIGADHRGFPLKQKLLEHLTANRYHVADCGAYCEESSDHPLQAYEVAKLVQDGKVDRGILICSNGIGMAIAANKVPGVYAAVVVREQDAVQCRKHNGANVICLGGDIVTSEQAQKMVDLFLTTECDDGPGERYKRRRDQILQFEEDHMKQDTQQEEDIS
jgi:RpiB/LacA/LacB family sugar-phosphate isomerase